MAVNRIPTHVRGFDEALGGGLPEGYVTLVSGAPGTMKSSFCFSILYQNALRDNRKSAYFTLEQSKDILLEHMTELGFTDEKAFKNMMVMDMGTVRKNLNFLQARGTWIELFKMYASNFMKEEKISLLALDSMDVMDIVVAGAGGLKPNHDGRHGARLRIRLLRCVMRDSAGFSFCFTFGVTSS